MNLISYTLVFVGLLFFYNLVCIVNENSLPGNSSLIYVSQFSELFQGLVLSALMFEADIGILPESITNWLTGLLMSFNHAESYVPSEGAWQAANTV